MKISSAFVIFAMLIHVAPADPTLPGQEDHADPVAIKLKPIPNRPKGDLVEVNGIKMYYEVYGKGQPVLLLHGGSASIESWSSQIPELEKHFKLIVPDSRGHGRTQDGAGEWSYKTMATDFEKLLEVLKIKKIAIVGWSDGGITGLEMAMRRPDLVEKLVAIGANYNTTGVPKEVRAGIEATRPDDYVPQLIQAYKALSPDGPAHWPVAFNKLKSMWLTQPNYEDADIQKVLCPTLVMAGDRDMVTPEHSLKLFQALPKGQLCIVPGASHYLPLEKPELVNTIVIDFLKSDHAMGK